ncbi:MAG: hypothetical protein AAB533_01610 [Patescibacteria group bacterium]
MVAKEPCVNEAQKFMETYSFPGQFKCMYCKEDLDPENKTALANKQYIELRCLSCGARWQFWASVQLNQRLAEGGKFNKTKKPPVAAAL